MGWFIRGRIREEKANPLNRLLIAIYHPLVDLVLKWRKTTLLLALMAMLSIAWPLMKTGSEFMPSLYEGDLLYMPTTLPGLSVTKAREILQQTDRIIRQFPEVEHVFGKIGRAETATDPAPMMMIETTITLKPESQWRTVNRQRFFTTWPAEMEVVKKLLRLIWPEQRPLTVAELTARLNSAIRFPGLTNAWTMPIKTRIDMLSTGIKTPVGIKIMGNDLATLSRIGEEVEAVVRAVPGTLSAIAERAVGGRYLDIHIDRLSGARYGINVGTIQEIIQTAIGGMSIGETVEGLERYPISVRYDRDFRSDIDSLKRVLVPGAGGRHIPLEQLARISISMAPDSIKSENGRRTVWVYVDIENRDLGSYVQSAKAAVASHIKLPEGYNIVWSGQYEYMETARDRLIVIIPLTVLIILVIIYVNTGSLIKTGIVFLAVPFSLVGAFWLLYLLDYNTSVAVWVGIIALAGLDAETGVVMLLYLDLAYKYRQDRGLMLTRDDLVQAIHYGAVQRIRPKMMTISVIIAGLLPIMWSHGAGADVMKRIAAPMVGGVITSGIMELLVYPVIFYIWRSRRLQKN
jgi:Cu(I)/Ag(I) efflux system membrane protein CusA/SilA